MVAQIHKNLKNYASVCLIKYEEKIKIVLLFNEGRKILKMRMYAMWHVPHRLSEIFDCFRSCKISSMVAVLSYHCFFPQFCSSYFPEFLDNL